MLKLRNNSLTNMLTLPLILSIITRQRIEDGDTTPFRAFIQGNEQFVKYGVGDDEDLCAGAVGNRRIVNICQCSNRICDDLFIVRNTLCQ